MVMDPNSLPPAIYLYIYLSIYIYAYEKKEIIRNEKRSEKRNI